MEDLVSKVIDGLFGPTGGLMAITGLVASWATHKWIAPKTYGVRIDVLEKELQAIKLEIKPYREFKENQAMEAMNATKVK